MAVAPDERVKVATKVEVSVAAGTVIEIVPVSARLLTVAVSEIPAKANEVIAFPVKPAVTVTVTT
jgi:hypothetical protein